jgi:hypothetical protein
VLAPPAPGDALPAAALQRALAPDGGGGGGGGRGDGICAFATCDQLHLLVAARGAAGGRAGRGA